MIISCALVHFACVLQTVTHVSEAAVFLCDGQYKISWNHHVLLERLVSMEQLGSNAFEVGGRTGRECRP